MSKEFRLGVFIFFSLAILACGVFLIGGRSEIFQSGYPVRVNFHNVAGLNEGAEVRVGGIPEGTVQRIDLPHHPNEDVTVTIHLAKATRGVVKRDSVASIRSEGLLGDKYVEVSFGSSDSARLGDGETIASEPPLDISDLFKKANDILDTAKGTVADIQGTASNLNEVSAKVNQGKGTIGALINDQTVYKQASAGAAAFQEDMEALKHNFLLRGFFNRRGYSDSSEIARNGIRSLPPEPYAKAFVYEPEKLFAKADTAKLKNQRILDPAGKFLESAPFGFAVVAASSGPKGDTEEERTLTQARAAVVRKYLADNFKCDDTRIKTIGLGKQTAGNGKIEIRIYSPGSAAPEAQSASAPAPSRARP